MLGIHHALDETVMTVAVIAQKPQQYRIPKSIESVLISKKWSHDRVLTSNILALLLLVVDAWRMEVTMVGVLDVEQDGQQ